MTATQNDLCSLRSTLTDPDLVELVAIFVDEIPARIEAIVTCATAGDWPQLARLGHQLKGASGSYGFAPLGEVCGRLELIAKNGDSVDELQAVLIELTELRQRICG